MPEGTYHEFDNADPEMLIDHGVQPNRRFPETLNDFGERRIDNEFDVVLHE